MKAITPLRTRRWKDLPIRTRGLVILGIPVLCLLAAVGVFASYQRLLAENQRLVLEVKQVKIATQQLLVVLSAAEIAMQNYGLTGDTAFLEAYQRAVANLPASARELQRQLAASVQDQALLELEALIQQSLAQLEQQRSQIEQSPPLTDARQTYRWLQQDDSVLNQTRQRIDRLMAQEEFRLEQSQQALQLQQQRGLRLLWIFLGIGILASALAIALFQQLARELAARESELQQANQQLRQANDRLQQFTADASHELRAPVAAILGQAQAGLLAPDEQAPRQRLQKIVEITKSMATLVNTLLFLARHEGSRISRPAVDVAPLLAEISANATNEAAQQQIQFSAVLPDRPVLVPAEPDLLKQAIANLLDNALRYTPPGGEVELRVMLDSQRVSIQVNDSGIGIPEADLPYIFNRFYRVDQVRRKTGGFGLGLAIAQQIVQSLGGEISVCSAVGQGSQFQITLPRADLP